MVLGIGWSRCLPSSGACRLGVRFPHFHVPPHPTPVPLPWTGHKATACMGAGVGADSGAAGGEADSGSLGAPAD